MEFTSVRSLMGNLKGGEFAFSKSVFGESEFSEFSKFTLIGRYGAGTAMTSY